MALKVSKTELDVAYSTILGNVTANFYKKNNNKHYLIVNGQGDAKITFGQKNDATYWNNKKIIIPNEYGDDIVFAYGTDTTTTALLKAGYEYGPILVDGYPSTDDSVSAYFFRRKKDEAVYLRVNADSDSDVTVAIKFKQKNEGQSADKISIPRKQYAQPDAVFEYGKTKEIEYNFIANRNGVIYGPIKVDDADIATNYAKGKTYKIFEDGKELGVLVDNDDELDFNINIDTIKISGPVGKSAGVTFKIFDNEREFAALDGNDDEKDFNIFIKSIDDDQVSRLDIYHFGEDPSINKRPVVIGIHAGAWMDQDKSGFKGEKDFFFRRQECIFVNINHRLSPQPPINKPGQYLGFDKNRIKFPCQIQDVANAIKWVHENIETYGGDKNSIVLYGNGSGAHLAALVSTNKQWLNEVGISPSIIKGCISSSNILWNVKEEIDKSSSSIIGDTKNTIYNVFGIDPSVGGGESNIDYMSSGDAENAYKRYSPDLHIESNTPPFLILTRGSSDTIARANSFEQKLNDQKVSVTHYRYPENRTYDQTEIASVIGSKDPPEFKTLPKSVPSVTTLITTFLLKVVPYSDPDNGIAETITINGKDYYAISGISTTPVVSPKVSTASTAPTTSTKDADSTAKASASSTKAITSTGIFKISGKEAISVGYIDPVLGYVTGLSICEANEYGQKNPGTTFVVADGDNNINYLNINEINNLTADFARSTKSCDGLMATIKCGEPVLSIFGGGGVGAQANLVIGRDGSVLAVDIIHKGYGYQYPPLAKAIDQCYFGNGATFEVFLGEVSDAYEVFDKESDFEDYYVCPPGTGFGTLYDGDGKEIGKWDPSLYTNPGFDPIAKQVSDYEKLINQIKNPWWTTRLKKPSKITGTDNSSLTIYPVSHPCKIVSIEEPAVKEPVITETEEVIFTLNPDGNSKNTETKIEFTSTDKGGKSFTLQPKSNKKNTEIKIKIDKNVEYEFRVISVDKSYGSVRNFKTISDKKVLIDYANSASDKNDLFLSCNIGKFDIDGKKKVGKFILKTTSPSTNSSTGDTNITVTENPEKTWGDFMNKYAVSPVPPSSVNGTDFAGKLFTLEWDEIFPYDGDYIFRGCKDNDGKLYIDNEFVSDLQGFNEDPSPIKKFVKGGLHTIKVDLINAPIYGEPAKEPESDKVDIQFNVYGQGGKPDKLNFSFISEDGSDSFVITGVSKNKENRTDVIKVKPNVNYKVAATSVKGDIEQGIILNGNKNKEGGLGSSNKIFADNIGSENDNDDIQITSNIGTFTSSNKKKAKNSNRSTYDLLFTVPAQPKTTKSSSSTVSSIQTKEVFNTIDYISKSDRKLWRTNPAIVGNSDFLNQYGISPFDTTAAESQKKSYAGVHVIRWSSINFPVDGDYDIELAVDDNVKLYIGNRESGGKVADDTGLRSVLEGGDEVIIDKKGFTSPGKSSGKSVETRFFKAGNYRIRAELEQIDVGPIAKGNPMALAIKITTKTTTSTSKSISSKSWCENPMGVAFTIEAPPVPIPQEQPPKQEGRCPPTPLWSTRFPKSAKQWYPVKYNGYRKTVEDITKSIAPDVTIPKKIVEDQEVVFTLNPDGISANIATKIEFTSKDKGAKSFILQPKNNTKDTQIKIKINKNVEYEFRVISVDKSYGSVRDFKTISNKKVLIDYTNSASDKNDLFLSCNIGKFTVDEKKKVGKFILEGTSSKPETITTTAKPKFIKKDGKFYLDMQEFSGEFDLDFRFMIGDTNNSKGTGLAAKTFEIVGTNIKFDRNQNGKFITNDKDIQKTFKIAGGKVYGPVVFAGGGKGSSVELLSQDQIAAYDAKSSEAFDKKMKAKNDSWVDFNVVISGASPVDVKVPRVESSGGWSKFLNRYAISPVPPLYLSGTDAGGDKFENSWDIEIPYDGFYKVEAEVDDIGKVFVDGTEVINLDRNAGKTYGTNKVFIPKGRRTIKIEVQNFSSESYSVIDQKIFNTLDWQVADTTTTNSSNIEGKFVQDGNSIYLQVSGTGTGEIDFVMDVNDSSFIAGLAAKEVIIPSDGDKLIFKRNKTLPQKETIKNSGKFSGGKKYGPIQIIGSTINSGTPRVNSNKIGLLDADGTDENIKLQIVKVTNSGQTSSTSKGTLVGGTSKDGVSYSGPSLFNYKHNAWSEFMNKNSLTPIEAKTKISGTYVMKWNNVSFPEDGQYEYKIQGDNLATFKIDGVKISETGDFQSTSPIQKYFSATKGKHTIEVELVNVDNGSKEFDKNPTGFALFISKKINKLSSAGKPWIENPIGIAVAISPPPCPKPSGGKGVVGDIIPINPGTGYTSPPTGGYPVALKLKDVIVPPDTTGINYKCGEDKIVIEPSNGAVLDYSCDSFGRIVDVKVIDPGEPFTEYPTIKIIPNPNPIGAIGPAEPTGVNFKAIPVFEIVRDPLPPPAPDKIIQVTDLVGLKQTGYVDGRPYYGAIFYKDGLKYAGYYETVGEPVRIYDTLQESITGRIVTPPSAIQRSGTDVTSNDPRLNIPGTPNGIVE